ncbi:hypothetical protein G7046_g7344 [Stylonectria norvegica]|nr:hypothetical protein G7046_g7344 [Stylonectria norvegica]
MPRRVQVVGSLTAGLSPDQGGGKVHLSSGLERKARRKEEEEEGRTWLRTEDFGTCQTEDGSIRRRMTRDLEPDLGKVPGREGAFCPLETPQTADTYRRPDGCGYGGGHELEAMNSVLGPFQIAGDETNSNRHTPSPVTSTSSFPNRTGCMRIQETEDRRRGRETGPTTTKKTAVSTVGTDWSAQVARARHHVHVTTPASRRQSTKPPSFSSPQHRRDIPYHVTARAPPNTLSISYPSVHNNSASRLDSTPRSWGRRRRRRPRRRRLKNIEPSRILRLLPSRSFSLLRPFSVDAETPPRPAIAVATTGSIRF